MSEQIPAPIIIRKKRPPDAEAHSGAWKIALADMMTAMMAFFMVLWLLSSTDTDTLSGIADHFKPPKIVVTRMISGSEGVFEGQSIPAPEIIPLADPSTSIMIIKDAGKSQNKELDSTNESLANADSDKIVANHTPEATTEFLELDRLHFKEIEQEISKMISNDPELSFIKNQIQFIREKEGLRIQIVEEEDSPMFNLGTSELLSKPSRLIRQIAPMIMRMPNKIIVRGHTDSHGYTNTDFRNNWILSMERAETTRKLLEASGIDRSRFIKIEGAADMDPYVAEDVYDPRNRRINIILKYMD